MSSNNFPETNAFLLILDSKCTPYSDNAQQLEELANFARKLERERDEALSKLSTVYRWIERNHPDGFIDSQSHVQNLDRVADACHDKLEAMRDERDQISRDLSSLLAGDCLDGHDAVEGARNGIAMREAIREACEALADLAERWEETPEWHNMAEHNSAWCGKIFTNVRQCKKSHAALAKLQPFRKP